MTITQTLPAARRFAALSSTSHLPNASVGELPDASVGDPAGASPDKAANGARVGRKRKGEASTARAERTRAKIAQAVIDLLGSSRQPPTAKQVAARAGVSVRLVFHHFEDMDALYNAVAQAQIERHWRSVRAVPPRPPPPRAHRPDRRAARGALRGRQPGAAESRRPRGESPRSGREARPDRRDAAELARRDVRKRAPRSRARPP